MKNKDNLIEILQQLKDVGKKVSDPSVKHKIRMLKQHLQFQIQNC
jgi:hypothetical protein